MEESKAVDEHGDGEVSVSVTSTLDEGDKKMLPCHNFVGGFCEKGSTCLFYHPAADDVVTAITSPPFPEEFGTQEAVDAAVKDLASVDATGHLQNKRCRSGPSDFGPGIAQERSATFPGHGRSAPVPVRRLVPARTQRYVNTRYDDEIDEDSTSPVERFRPRVSRRRPWVTRSYRQFGGSGFVPRDYVDDTTDEARHYIDHYLPPVSTGSVSPMTSGHLHLDPYESSFEDCDFQAKEPYSGLEEPETMFGHIDWMQFLAPGQLPPPIVPAIPYGDPPVRKHGRNLLEIMIEPPGYSAPDHKDTSCAAAMSISAKQEFRLKLGQLAAGFNPHTLLKEDETASSGSEDGLPLVKYEEKVHNTVAVQ